MSDENQEPPVEEPSELPPTEETPYRRPYQPSRTAAPKRSIVSPTTEALDRLRQMRDAGKIDPLEFMIVSSQLRREEREDLRFQRELERDEERKNTPPVDIKGEVKAAVAETVKELKPSKGEEKPEWAENLDRQNKEILEKFQKAEDEKKTTEIIEKAIHPYEDKLKERDTVIANLETKLGDLTKKVEEKGSAVPAGTDKLTIYKEVDDILKGLGIKGTEQSVYSLSGGEGMHVKGEIPAWVAYGPDVVDKIATTIEKRINAVAQNLGLSAQPATAPASETELISLPPKPPAVTKTETQPPPPPPATPTAPATETVQPPPVELEKVEQLIKLPEKPAVQTSSPPPETKEASAPTPATGTPPAVEGEKKPKTKRKSKKKEEAQKGVNKGNPESIPK